MNDFINRVSSIFSNDQKINYSKTKSENFSYEAFEKCLSSCNKDSKRVLNLFQFIIQIKLNDIFARGFVVHERLKKTTKISQIKIENESAGLLNFYDIILLSLSNIARDFVIVFNSDLNLPSSGDVFLGFYTKNSVISKLGINAYTQLDDKLKFCFEIDNLFCRTEHYLQIAINAFDLMQDRITHGTKTILQKEDSKQLMRSDPAQIKAFTAQNFFESSAFLQNNAKSVLTIPQNTNILFPTADVTQIEKAYIRAIDWLLACFRIPSTKFFGQSPSGFQSTGNLEILNYEQSLDEIFEYKMAPILEHLSNLISEPAEISPVSFYKLNLLEKINNARSIATSKQIIKYCDNLITTISGIEPDEEELPVAPAVEMEENEE